MADHVDLVLEQRRERRPDLDASPMVTSGAISRRLDQLAGLLRSFLESVGDKLGDKRD